MQRALIAQLEAVWDDPDEGIWEVRGGRHHFTHSKVMAWVALDRAIRSAEEFRLSGPLDRWRALRDHIHADVCRKGYDADAGVFVQCYGERALDARLDCVKGLTESYLSLRARPRGNLRVPAQDVG